MTRDVQHHWKGKKRSCRNSAVRQCDVTSVKSAVIKSKSRIETQSKVLTTARAEIHQMYHRVTSKLKLFMKVKKEKKLFVIKQSREASCFFFLPVITFP